MSAIFVTGTGTDIGKTFVTAALVRHLRAAGREASALKPVVSGFDMTAAEASDPGVLLAAQGKPVNAEEIERISPWRFSAPIAPDMAAAREGCSIDFKALVAFSQRAADSAGGTLLIEGVGGVMVPLDAGHTVLDWMSALRLPVLMVAGSYLGTISHTLTALHVVALRKLEICAIVVSESANSSVPLGDTVAAISRFSAPIDVIGVPRIAGDTADHAAIAGIAKLLP
jgi:dethiobiotin synthetase